MISVPAPRTPQQRNKNGKLENEQQKENKK